MYTNHLKMNEIHPTSPKKNTYLFSWTSIVAGALVGLGLGFLLDLFSMSIGLSLYKSTTEGLITLAIGGFLGLTLGGIITMFIAGFTAGFFAGPFCDDRNLGATHGFVAWCLSLFLTGIFSLPLAHFIQSKYNYPISFLSHAKIDISQTQKDATNKNNLSYLHAMTNNTSNTQDVQDEKSAHAIGIISLSIFLIFFFGAISASTGGYYGLLCWKNWEVK